MRYAEHIRIGIRSILAHKLRSALTTLGIIFGVAGLVAMMSIAEGARREAVERTVEGIATDRVVDRLYAAAAGPQAPRPPAESQKRSRQSLNPVTCSPECPRSKRESAPGLALL